MSVNNKAKKLTTLSQTAIKSLFEGQVLGWFLVEQSKGSYYFLVDKKQTSAAKFKSPKIVKALLERYGVDTAKVTDKSEFLAGTVGLAEGNYEMVVATKKNGAGTSTLRTVIKDSGFKKILKTVSIVKVHSLSVSQQHLTAEEASEIQHEEEDKQTVASATAALSLNEKEQAALRLALWAKDNISKMYTPNPGSELEDFFHKCVRRLEKFKGKKLYKMFDPKYWNKKFRDVEHPLFDKLGSYRHTKEYNEVLIKVCTTQLKLIEAAAENEDIEALVNELYDSDFVESFTGFEQKLTELQFTKKEIPEIISAFGADNMTEFTQLLEVCGGKRKQMMYLLSAIGHNSWPRLLGMLDQIEYV